MAAVELTFPGAAMQTWVGTCEKALHQAAATAVNRTAAKVRTDINSQIPSLFARTVPITRRATLYMPADGEQALDKMSATIFVRDELPKGTPPSKYLAAEILGGPRRDKRSERSLIAAGIMHPGQQSVPGGGLASVAGSQLVQALSQVKAFGEQGYRANATSRTAKRLRAKGTLVTRKTGMNYFVAKGKWTGAPTAIYQLVGPGKVKPVLWFIEKRANYKARLPFFDMVEHSAARIWPMQMEKALIEAMKSNAQ